MAQCVVYSDYSIHILFIIIVTKFQRKNSFIQLNLTKAPHYTVPVKLSLHSLLDLETRTYKDFH